MFWDQFYQLCKESGKSPTEVVEQLGIARGSITKWKGGSLPSGKNLSKIADYFSVPVDRLFSSEEKEKSPSVSDEDLKFALFGGDKDIPDEVLDEVKRFAVYAKERYGKK